MWGSHLHPNTVTQFLCSFSLIFHSSLRLRREFCQFLKGRVFVLLLVQHLTLWQSKAEDEEKAAWRRCIQWPKHPNSVFTFVKVQECSIGQVTGKDCMLVSFPLNISSRKGGPWNKVCNLLQDGWGLELTRYKLCVHFRPGTRTPQLDVELPGWEPAGYFRWCCQ